DAAERTGRRRPFSTWIKKLANLKHAATIATHNHQNTSKRNSHVIKTHGKKPPIPESNEDSNNNIPKPRDEEGIAHVDTEQSPSAIICANSSSSSPNCRSSDQSSGGGTTPTIENKSMAATLNRRANSVQAPSHAPSSGQETIGNMWRGNGSTFSSPAPSVRSLTTTLTTLQSAAPTAAANNHLSNNQITMQFSPQLVSSPLNAIPPYLVSQGTGCHPSTYNTATANNLLTDNASILTLASSSNRRRRRSMDTDASVRALAPSSIFGGSRESLPMSILSSNIDTNSYQPRLSIGGPTERGSIYSVAGVNTTLASERNSYYAGKQSIVSEAGSIKSGLVGHNLRDSVSGCIGANLNPGSPLTSPRDLLIPCPGNLNQNRATCNKDEDLDDEEYKNRGTFKRINNVDTLSAR
ncbi:Bgt-1867, partial [Blumeria graminis f. sp. tritici]